jgi:hypothetical protein
MQSGLDAEYERQMLLGDYELRWILQHRWYQENVWSETRS